MRISQKSIIISILVIITLWFMYMVRSVLTPFILAAVFAYILSPLVSFFQNKLRFHKMVAVIFVYSGVVLVLGFISTELGIRLAMESREFSHEYKGVESILFYNLGTLPYWLRNWIMEVVRTVNTNGFFSPQKIWPYFSGALTGIGSIFVFLISGFYFLKEGDEISKKFTSLLPSINKVEVAILIKKMSMTLNNYLRGQIFLIVLMSAVSYLGLSYMGVRYALILGIFTGFAEVIPFIGPFIAGTAACLVALLDGYSSFGMSPLFEIAIIASMYFLFRQIEDIFVIPYVMGHATKLHPLIVLFAVLAGGHLWGVMGMILAVPTAAIVRLVLEYYYTKIT